MPFGDFLEARIFRPAGMNSTKLNDPLSLVPGRSQGYVIRENRVINGVNLRPAVTAPSGGVLTTIGDLARYERILREAPDLSEASNAQILRPVRLNSGQRFPYGMVSQGRPAHSGGVPYRHYCSRVSRGLFSATSHRYLCGISLQCQRRWG
jgi:CubicO group peptidase (beta-lactamase class C family)